MSNIVESIILSKIGSRIDEGKHVNIVTNPFEQDAKTQNDYKHDKFINIIKNTTNDIKNNVENDVFNTNDFSNSNYEKIIIGHLKNYIRNVWYPEFLITLSKKYNTLVETYPNLNLPRFLVNNDQLEATINNKKITYNDLMAGVKNIYKDKLDHEFIHKLYPNSVSDYYHDFPPIHPSDLGNNPVLLIEKFYHLKLAIDNDNRITEDMPAPYDPSEHIIYKIIKSIDALEYWYNNDYFTNSAGIQVRHRGYFKDLEILLDKINKLKKSKGPKERKILIIIIVAIIIIILVIIIIVVVVTNKPKEHLEHKSNSKNKHNELIYNNSSKNAAR